MNKINKSSWSYILKISEKGRHDIFFGAYSPISMVLDGNDRYI